MISTARIHSPSLAVEPETRPHIRRALAREYGRVASEALGAQPGYAWHPEGLPVLFAGCRERALGPDDQLICYDAMGVARLRAAASEHAAHGRDHLLARPLPPLLSCDDDGPHRLTVQVLAAVLASGSVTFEPGLSHHGRYGDTIQINVSLRGANPTGIERVHEVGVWEDRTAEPLDVVVVGH